MLVTINYRKGTYPLKLKWFLSLEILRLVISVPFCLLCLISGFLPLSNVFEIWIMPWLVWQKGISFCSQAQFTCKICPSLNSLSANFRHKTGRAAGAAFWKPLHWSYGRNTEVPQVNYRSIFRQITVFCRILNTEIPFIFSRIIWIPKYRTEKSRYHITENLLTSYLLPRYNR